MRKEPTKEHILPESKFSPVGELVRKNKPVSSQVLVSIIQTNLIKFYVDLHMESQLFEFFSKYERTFHYNSKELIMYLQKFQQHELGRMALAMIHEFNEEFEESLSIWFRIRND